MAGEYGIQYFHSAGSWQPFGAFQHMTFEKAMAQAKAFAENLHAYPLGVRVTGPGQWASEQLGGREEIELTYNPVTEVWTGVCAKCPGREESAEVYVTTNFAREHTC